MEKSSLNSYLGKIVKVVVERAIGDRHPIFGYPYPVNYGYIPNTKSEDGDEIDVFILGEDKPIKDFEGEVIAVIHRLNDKEDKLVCVPKDMKITTEEIEDKLWFQEKWYKHILIRK